MTAAGLVHVIDDDAAVRDSLGVLLDAAGLSVRTWPSAQDFLEGLAEARSGCIVTDVRMPDVSGLELLRRLADRRAEFPTIVLTGEADVPMAVEALKGGAVDFIEKPFEAAAILVAVRGALKRLEVEGGRSTRRNDSAQRLAGLSGREREVLSGLVAGHSNKEVARDLGISPRTVEAYRAKLMVKTGAESLPELVRMALHAQERD